MEAANIPVINYLGNEHWGVVSVFYGFNTPDFEKIEGNIKEKLMAIAIAKNYSEINIMTTEFSLDAWVQVIYKFVPNE